LDVRIASKNVEREIVIYFARRCRLEGGVSVRAGRLERVPLTRNRHGRDKPACPGDDVVGSFDIIGTCSKTLRVGMTRHRDVQSSSASYGD